ncbi:MAG: hypothetical protein ACREF5_03425 [Candidatus Saccharimonadales bacterium]
MMLGLIGLLIVGLIAGAYGSDKLLQNQSQSLVNDRLQTAVLAQEQTELVEAKQDIKKYQGLAVIAGSVVPQDKDQAETIRQIANIASENGVTLGSITLPSSSLGLSESGQPVTQSSTSSLQLSQLTPVVGIPGVYSLQLVVESDTNSPVPYNNFINFLNDLENNRRTALIDSITIEPNTVNRNDIDFTLTLDEYIKP